MVKQVKNILIVTIIAIMLIEFVFATNTSFAITSGEVPLNAETINTMNNLAGGIVSILFWRYRATFVIACFVIDAMLNIIAAGQGTNTFPGSDSLGSKAMITPFDIFFNRYKMLDINVFDTTTPPSNSMLGKFRASTAMWYYTMRTLAAAILLVILIYVGIRMLLSSVAEDRAKYKKMLFDWICSLLLLFLLQYMAIFIIYLNNAIVAALRSFVVNSAGADGLGKISESMIELGKKGIFGIGMSSITAMFAFGGLVIMTVAFFIAYLNRMFKVAFLIMISPLITITYSIDKIGDGKAQALGNWLKQYISTVIIQPFHCIIYISFVQTAFNLVTMGSGDSFLEQFMGGEYNQIVNCFLAIVCLLFVFQCEGIVRTIFGIKEDKDTSALAGVVLSMAALSKAKQVGGAARKGINGISQTHKKINQALSKDNKLFANLAKQNPNSKLASGLEKLTGAGLKANEALSDLSRGINKVTDRVKTFKSLPGKKLSDWAKNNKDKWYGRATQTAIKGFKRVNDMNKSLSVAATLGAITSLASGGSVFEAAKAYESIGEGAREFNSTSKDNIADLNATLNSEMDDTELDDKIDQLHDLDNQLSAAKLNDEGTFDRVLAIRKGIQASADLEANQKELEALRQKKAETGTHEFDDLISEKEREAIGLQGLIDNAEAQGELSDSDRELLDLMNKRESTKYDIEHFFDQAAVEARARARQESVSTSKLQAKKNEIIAILTQLKVAKGNGVTDIVADNEYSQETIGAVMANLTADMQKSALMATGFNGDEKMGQIAAALHVDESIGDNAEEFAKVRALLGELDNMYKQKEMSTNVQKFTGVGGNKEALSSAVTNRSYGRAKQHQIPSFKNIEDL